jgi:propanol-preferring alcohol dehydrogenase
VTTYKGIKETVARPGQWTCGDLPPGEFPTPLSDVVADCITIRDSFVGTRQAMNEALAYAVAGKVKAYIGVQPLTAINQILERVEKGEVPLGVVINFPPRCRLILLSSAAGLEQRLVTRSVQ